MGTVEIYSSLTRDTTKPEKKDTVPVRVTRPMNYPSERMLNDKSPIDSLSDSLHAELDSTIVTTVVDTFSLRLSKDTLDAPVEYEAEDSAVVIVADKKVVLYGKTKTTYKDIVLTAPKVELENQTGMVSAFNNRDSLGEVITRARFEQGANQFESDTIRFNFKTQKGLTQNTFTQQDEIYIQGEAIKKVDANTLFIHEGRFTTCNLDEPHFHFQSDRMKVINNKVAVTGFVQLAFEDVPIPKPVGLPFGIFPLSRGRHSGFLPPTFTTNEEYGVGLDNLGYYKVINDNVDVTLRGSLYSYGGWTANLTPTYRRRYKYSGAFNLGVMTMKQNFKGDPDYNKSQQFQINWNHSVDQRARPGVSFSANVAAGSTKYNSLLPNDPSRNFNNQLTSSISYSKTWIGRPFNLSLSANHSQNARSRLINVLLPEAGFTVTTLYPFQKKEAVGSPKWYEKLGIGYSGNFTNQVAFYDTALTVQRLLDTLQWGARHRVPITLSLPPMGPFIISPNVSYEEQWFMSQTEFTWNGTKVDTSLRKGLFAARNITTGISANTAIFGKFNFGKTAFRHVIRPNFGLSYTPNLAKGYWDVVRIDAAGTKREYSKFAGNLFGYGYSNQEFGGINFGVDNNLEMKLRSKKDTSAEGVRKVRLIEGFGFSSSYNFLRDSLQLGDFAFYFRSNLFDKVNITASANLTPYELDTNGFVIDKYVWQERSGFKPGRITTASISLSTQFRSKPRDPSKTPETMQNTRQITDPALLADQQRLQEYMQRNANEFVDFNVPWDIGLDLAISISRQLQPDLKSFKTVTSASLNFRNSFSLTPKWNFTTNGYYDLTTKKLQTFTMSINRDLHCWQMAVSVTPVGPYSYFSITISPKSSLLQDLRVNRTRQFTNF